ncbi:heme-binding protein [Nitrospirillum iridis]|uniref:Uncharacterized protein GlcG (DUF336 family) n=1 Tax=Nitrospirillum iridis TaxID=765888 RepID=A0A7X0B2Y5_9PROT|nr:heme-binding protein [Nitrospirillum iridis]MBB6253254.1 uncharacterized protein GlcG (DUF336 family) [Nitrospirillum iridis]
MKITTAAMAALGVFIAVQAGAQDQEPASSRSRDTALSAPYNGPMMGPRPGEPTPPPPPGPRPPDVVARGPSIELALEAAKAVVTSCKGYQVGIAVLDAAGLPKLYYVPDGTAGSHAYTGFRKANSALLIGAPSEQITTRIATDKGLADKVAASTNYASWAGGLPIMVNGEVIGAIGVSGAEPSEKDEACARDGLREIQSRLK